jgi:radical SAM superfamily enzyme YgiQ (UPF0313 family)
MKVAIIAPPYPLAEAPAPPLGASYVAAAFEAAGAEVVIFDYNVSQYTPDKLRKMLSSYKPDVVGATSVTMNFKMAAEIVTTAKKHDPSIITMMGGPHVSFDAAGALQNYPEIDMIVIGEGEETIKALMAVEMEADRWEKVEGIAFRRDDGIVFTKPRKLIADLDTLPLPARHLLPLSRYQALGFPISIITSRGCPYPCIFCQGRRMVGKKVRYRSPALVADEIEHILFYGMTRINVADDLFTANKERARKVCEEIQRRKLKFAWSAFARVNTVDREILEIMRDTGCDSVSFGIESGNQEMLDRIQKKITLDEARRAVKICKEVGILAHASFMVGLPGESPQSLHDTQKFADSLDIHYGYHFLAPFPGTTVREKVDEYDIDILTDDWDQYDANRAIVKTSKLSPEEITEFVAAFDKEINDEWENQVRRYKTGANTPEENLQVEGHFRTKLVYKLLSEDIIERFGRIDMASNRCKPEEALDLLCNKIQYLMNNNVYSIRKVLMDFIELGYIKFRQVGNTCVWCWTHNRNVDFL